MADATPEQEGLNEDTVAFLDIRNPVRTTLSDTMQPPTDGDDCELTHNDKFAALNPAPYQGEQAEGGWPSADNLYEQQQQQYKGEVGEDAEQPVMGDIAVGQLQIDTLEAYRRTTLHRRQRRCHLIAAWTASLANEPQSQSELQSLMLNKNVGQYADAGDANDEVA